RRRIVSLLFARETLDFSEAHAGIIALTPAAADEASKLAPKTRIAHLGWGVDLKTFPSLPYNPKWILHCGIAGRDFHVLHGADLGAASSPSYSPGKPSILVKRMLVLSP